MNRQQIHQKYNGHFAYCGCEISLKEMQVDHIIPKYGFELRFLSKKHLVPDFLQHIDNVNHPDNFNPSCRQCNFYKGEMSIEAFRIQLATTLKQNIEKPFQFRLGLKYGMVEIKEWDNKFYFEKYERDVI